MSYEPASIECEKCSAYNCKFYCEKCYNKLKKKYEKLKDYFDMKDCM